MKKLMLGFVLSVCVVAFATQAMARNAVYNQDMAGSKQLQYMTCYADEEFVGIAYNDTKHGDAMDAISVFCRDTRNNRVRLVPNHDFGDRQLVEVRCDVPNEYVIAIKYKDRQNSDEADGATVTCRNKMSGRERDIYVHDLAGGRMFVTMRGVHGKRNNIGIAYNDRINSDAVDGITIVTK